MKKLAIWAATAAVGLAIHFHTAARTPQPPTSENTEIDVQAAYERLRVQVTSKDELAALEMSQRAWAKDRDGVCANKSPQCLIQQNISRRYFLEGRAVEGLKAQSAVRPFFTHRPGDKDQIEVTATQLKFINPKSPAELALNDFMDKQLQIALENSRNTSSPPKEEKFYSLMGTELSFVSPALISARVDGSYYLGQAHPEPWGQSININVKTGKTLNFNELTNAGSSKKIFVYCQTQIEEKKANKSNGVDKISDKEMAELTSDLNSWKFSKNSAVIQYSMYAFGGYGQCNCTCDIPYSTLRPLAKKTFPLPHH